MVFQRQMEMWCQFLDCNEPATGVVRGNHLLNWALCDAHASSVMKQLAFHAPKEGPDCDCGR